MNEVWVLEVSDTPGKCDFQDLFASAEACMEAYPDVNWVKEGTNFYYGRRDEDPRYLYEMGMDRLYLTKRKVK